MQENEVTDWFCEQEEFSNDSIVLDSLEEIEFSAPKVKQGEVCLLRLLLLMCRAVPRRVVVHATERTPNLMMRTCVKIANFCNPDTDVEFYRYLAGRYELMWARYGQSQPLRK